MRQLKGRGEWCMALKSRPTALMKHPRCQWPTSWPKRGSTKRYVDILIPWRIEAGTKCGEVAGQAFDREGLLGRISGVATHGETYTWWRKRRTGHPDVWVRRCVMQAVLEPCTVKMTSLEESNQHNSGAKKIEDTIVERQDGYHAVKGVELGSRLRHTISYGAPAKELKDTRPSTSTRIGKSQWL